MQVRAGRLGCAVSIVCAALAGCDPQVRYIGDDKLYRVALTPETAPALEGEEGALFIVEQRAELPVREPEPEELRDLQSGVARFPGLPFPRLPWVEREDLPLQVDFTLSNLEDAARDVDVTINGANEFHEYVPAVIEIDDEAPVPLHAQWERRFHLEPFERATVTVREEELDEVAVDLATVVNGAPNSDQIVYFENNSANDPRARPFIPALIPGLIALRFGLRSTQAGLLLLEASVRVRDVGKKLADSGEPPVHYTPELFESVVPET